MVFPDRLSGLIKRIEAGETVTQKDVNQVTQLQLLDIAKIGEDFARDVMQRNADQTETMRKSLEQLNV